MKTRLVILTFSFLLFTLVSCKKEKEDNAITNSTWTLNGKTYTALNTAWYSNGNGYSPGNELTAEVNGTEDAVAIIVFKNRPSSGSNYNIVFKDDISDLQNSEVVVGFYDDEDILYYATNGKVSVSVKNNKIKASFSNITVVDENGITTKASGTLVEK